MPSAYDPADDHGDPGHRLAKSVWTDADFDVMGWHDCWVRALALVPDETDEFAAQLLLDLDYIVRWAGGENPGEPFTFWIAPATLVFHGVYDLDGRIAQSETIPAGFECDSLARTPVEDQLGYDHWELAADIDIGFRAAGFRQIIRSEPQHVARQHLTLEERGGLSFGTVAYDGASCELAVTHALTRAERRLDESAGEPEGAAPAPRTPEQRRNLEWELAHTRLWALVTELHRAELGGAPPAAADAHAAAHLASGDYQALGDGPQQLVADRDQMLQVLRDGARTRALGRIDSEHAHLMAEIARLSRQLGD